MRHVSLSIHSIIKPISIMKSKLCFFAVLLLSTALISCNSEVRTAETSDSQTVYPPDMHTSQLAIDFEGTYRGILPCADCSGILTEITLDENMNFTKQAYYVGKSPESDNEAHEIEGTFSWREDGNTIRLEGMNPDEMPTIYQVGENRLFQFDLEGNRITGDLADKYILHRHDNDLQNTYWRLIELRGQEVEMNEQRDIHLIFHVTDNRVTGNAGCNSFFGEYTLEDGYRLSMNRLASTMMACENMEIETELLPLLAQVDNFTISEDGTLLSLNRARMAPLARYTRVF